MNTTRDYTLTAPSPDRSRAPRTASPPRRAPRPNRHGLSGPQDRLYWREWAACRKALLAAGYAPGEADGERHRLHRGALGEDKGHREFTNRDFDLVLAAFRAVSQPDNMDAQLAGETGTRRRLMWSLLRLASGRESYVESIASDCFGTRQWRRLDDAALTKLRATLARRVERRGVKQEGTEISKP